ncbi:2-dehydro-3-deoxygluconokinase [bioreactor metagenome]|uniref:2-dehydro-3-deoxygluconokinase n=1 Tax=bioreactor metagenome TaxID=1076179 RepID=A0A645E3F0_9ZZZZ
MNSFGVDTKDILLGEGRLGIYFLEQGNGLRNSDVIYDRKYSAISMAQLDEFDINNILKDVKLLHISGINPALSKDLKELTLQLAKECKKRNIVVSYDSNFRAKLWNLEDAREFMLEILNYVDIAFLGILDFKNILKYEIPNDSFENNLKVLYKQLFENYANLQYAASTRRKVNSVNNNSLTGFLFDGENINISKEYTFDILDRVGGGDSYTAGILHGLINNMSQKEVVEFATCASALKHSISGDINLVNEDDIKTLMISGVENIKR